MSFDIFDENYYLAKNPDVAAAVAAGAFSSGLEHFQLFGINEGRTVSPLYNEALYLLLYPDVAAAVAAGVLSSGLKHYILSGEAEGRFGVTGLYNEQAYLQAYPDVANAVNTGILSSGFEHFANFVLAGSSRESRYDALFNEQYYLGKYPDIAAAVNSGAIDSGLEHFLAFGLDEGRVGGANFNEGFYLRDNPDVAAAVKSGVIESGLVHFAHFGEAEGRSGTYFDEGIYRLLNPDIAAAVSAGKFTSGAHHYLEFGQFENRLSGFTGTSGNDTIRSFGSSPLISGVSLSLGLDPVTGQINQMTTGSIGTGEVDTLIGFSDIEDVFLLGNLQTDQAFYRGYGNSDYALIRNFDPASDYLLVALPTEQYYQEVSNGNLHIFASGDLMAVIEGITTPLPISPFNTSSLVSADLGTSDPLFGFVLGSADNTLW